MSAPLTSVVTDFSQYTGLRAAARTQDPVALEKTAKQFEALLLQQMLKSMRAACSGDELLGGEQTQFYTEMFDQQLSATLAGGKGIGIAELMVKQLQMSQALSAPEQPPLVPPSPEGSGKTEESAATDFRPKTPQQFIDAVLPHAEKAARELGIPARVLVAQAALETGWGKHQIRHADGSSAFNLFGIKADKSWAGERVRTLTHEYDNGRLEKQAAKFRAYGSIEAAFDDYVQFLKANPRYSQALQHGGNAQRFATGLQQAGYATDPGYAQKILRIAYGPTMQAAITRTRSVTA